MTIEKVRELYNTQPFGPFIMHLADGRRLTVHHREFMAIAPSGRTLVVHQPNDSMNIIDLLVTDLEIKKGNGTSARSRRTR